MIVLKVIFAALVIALAVVLTPLVFVADVIDNTVYRHPRRGTPSVGSLWRDVGKLLGSVFGS